MTAIAATTPGTAALTARASCEAAIGWRTELVDGFPKERIELCSQVVGLSGYVDASGRRHYHCAAPHHAANVLRRFPRATTGSAAWEGDE